MPESKLPPGPWRIASDGPGMPIMSIRDADDNEILDTEDEALHGRTCGAIEDFPLLAEAARGLIQSNGKKGWTALVDALARIDEESA